MNRQRERAELETVLSSTLFVRAPDLSKILRHVCEKHFSNEADTIKEYSIAVEALGRGPNFRPEEDSIVRVQAARLRKHLKKYYETDGVDHPLQIRISATGYKPEFMHAGGPGGQDADERDSNGKPASPPADSFSAETPQPASTGEGLDRPAFFSWGRLAPILALLATALIVAVVGVNFKHRSVEGSAQPPPAPPALPADLSGVNIRAGFAAPTYLDPTGATWLGDRYFKGGVAFNRGDSPILRTFDQTLYQTGRQGSFSYAIPLRQGDYEVHLHFAEVFFGPAVGADTQRAFDISINGVLAIKWFDIAKDAGGVSIADEKIFKDVFPGKDGFLRLDFFSERSQALLNGIEVLPGARGKTLPVRILCSNHSGVDRNGQLWKADQYFSGGRISELADSIKNPDFGGLSSYRTGNFNYAIPVAGGAYRVRLLLAEPVYGHETSLVVGLGGAGYRLFDIFCNGSALARGIDIFREAGGGYRVLEKTFRGLKPDSQGKIQLSFVPVKGYAVLLALEVLDENW